MLARIVLALLLLPALAGCLTTAPTEGPATAAVAPADGPGDGGLLNQFLLDAPRPPGAKVSGGEEPMVLVDRAGAFVLVGDTSGVYRSADGGTTWARVSIPTVPGAFIDGYALAQDEAGTVYASNTQGQALYFAKSTDGGRTWTAPATGKVTAVDGIADRPWLAARGSGQVAGVMNGLLVGETCFQSRDGGSTWTDRQVTGGAANAGNIVFDDRGSLYYALDDGVYRYLTPCKSGVARLALPASGPQIFTQVDVDPARKVYVAQPSADSKRMTIRAFSSWSASTYKEVTVSPPELKSNTFGAISVSDTEVAVAWYGSEAAGNPAGAFSGSWNVYVARVTGFWTATPTVTYSRLTTEPNHVGGFCMGGIGCSTGTADRDLLDYFGLDHAPDGTIFVAYGHDGAGSVAEVRYARIAP